MTNPVGLPDRATDPARTRPIDRVTIAAGITLLVITALHTAAFAVHGWWGAWLAGPFRSEQLPLDAAVQFWGLPGGFVVPGLLLGLLTVASGRRGETMPAYVGIGLAAWALACVWIVGPSGFVLVLAPSTLLIVASARARRRGPAVD